MTYIYLVSIVFKFLLRISNFVFSNASTYYKVNLLLEYLVKLVVNKISLLRSFSLIYFSKIRKLYKINIDNIVFPLLLIFFIDMIYFWL